MNKFDEFYSKKTVVELLEKLKQARINPTTMDKEWYEALIIHLNSRGLSGKAKSMMEHILSADPEILKGDKALEETIKSGSDKSVTSSSNFSEAGRYSALKTVVGLISALGGIVILAGIIALIYLGQSGQVAMGLVALIISVVIALPLLAYSNLIHVFIDIEYNTRKVREEIKLIGK